MPALVVFVDCVSPEEAQQSDYLGSTYKGQIDSHIPRVTPIVLGGILTGQTPKQNGLLCPTRINGTVTRPKTKTLIEDLAETRQVLNVELPFTVGLEGKNLVNIGTAVGQSSPRPAQFVIPKPNCTMWLDEPDIILQGYVDYLRALFGTVRNVIRNNQFEVIFLAIRCTDSFGHFLYPEHRAQLIKYVDFEIEDTEKLGDISILAFSDHGITPKKHAFYLNKWLIEHGYLEVEVFEPGIRKAQEDNIDFMEQADILSPFVDIKDSSYLVSPDAFDSGIKMLKDIPLDTVKDELMATGMYKGIYEPEELYGAGECLNDELGVDLVCDRADGVLVSGNVWPHLDSTVDPMNHCQCTIRTGVHSRFGFYGANRDISEGTYKPWEFHEVLKKFILDNSKPIEQAEEQHTAKDEQQVREHLAGLGYI